MKLTVWPKVHYSSIGLVIQVRAERLHPIARLRRTHGHVDGISCNEYWPGVCGVRRFCEDDPLLRERVTDTPCRTDRCRLSSDIRTLRFLKRARGLGFSVEQMRDLLALWRDEGRSKAEVMELALSHAEALEAKAREINEITTALRDLARRCQINDEPGCIIIDELADIPHPVLGPLQP